MFRPVFAPVAQDSHIEADDFEEELEASEVLDEADEVLLVEKAKKLLLR